MGSRGDSEGTYLSRTLAISFCFPPRGAVLRCIGFGLRPRLSSCRRSDRWLSLYPAPCLGLFENYPVSGSVPMGNTWFPSCRRVRYLGDECHIMICSSFWIPGFHGFMTTFRSRVSISEVHFSEFNPDSSWFLPCSWAALGGCGWGAPGFRRAPSRVVHRILLPLGCCFLWGAGSRLASASFFDGG